MQRGGGRGEECNLYFSRLNYIQFRVSLLTFQSSFLYIFKNGKFYLITNTCINTNFKFASFSVLELFSPFSLTSLPFYLKSKFLNRKSKTMYVPNYKLFCKTARPSPINLLLSLSFCPLSSKFPENSVRMPEITIYFSFRY